MISECIKCEEPDVEVDENRLCVKCQNRHNLIAGVAQQEDARRAVTG